VAESVAKCLVQGDDAIAIGIGALDGMAKAVIAAKRPEEVRGKILVILLPG